MTEQMLFEGGFLGYDAYRIPAVVSLPGNRVLAFCEGRVTGIGDAGEIHILLRISVDGGETFAPQRVVAARPPHTLGNPSPVFDPDTGRLWLFCNFNRGDGAEPLIREGKAPRDVLLTFSDDMGESWAPLTDLTSALKPSGWGWYACGPGHALCTRDGALIIPCDHTELVSAAGTPDAMFSHLVRSDDHGKSWTLGPSLGERNNESTIAQLPDGRLYFNLRSYAGQGCRNTAFSADGGRTFGEQRLDASLPDPVCQGSVLGTPDGVLFSNPASPNERVRLTVRFSPDALHWREVAVVHEGPSGYSDLCLLENGEIGCLYETGKQDSDGDLVFARFSQKVG